MSHVYPLRPYMGRCSHGDLSNGSPDGVAESIENWLLEIRGVRR